MICCEQSHWSNIIDYNNSFQKKQSIKILYFHFHFPASSKYESSKWLSQCLQKELILIYKILATNTNTAWNDELWDMSISSVSFLGSNLRSEPQIWLKSKAQFSDYSIQLKGLVSIIIETITWLPSFGGILC